MFEFFLKNPNLPIPHETPGKAAGIGTLWESHWESHLLQQDDKENPGKGDLDTFLGIPIGNLTSSSRMMRKHQKKQ